ncbi:MAG: ABC transporter ATP-binding protein [Clostridia bacterium]|jgi:putative ABC transport system ATP-binding protein|nr:ABC transporter ATP-binding protein [Clostridia bacterium]
MIDIIGVKKAYGNKEARQEVLKGIDLEIKDGEFVVILGASGSGKTTLLNIASSLEKADSGKVVFDNVDITTLQDKELTLFRKDNIGFIFQAYYLLPNLTVEKNVKLGAALVNNKNYKEIIKAVGLEEKMHKYPSELSGGEQQRVAIARAIAKQPKVLFLDEPTGALDEQTGRDILDLISQLHKQNKFTILMVTHNQNIADMADKVVKLNSGKIESIKENSSPKTAFEIGW